MGAELGGGPLGSAKNTDAHADRCTKANKLENSTIINTASPQEGANAHPPCPARTSSMASWMTKTRRYLNGRGCTCEAARGGGPGFGKRAGCKVRMCEEGREGWWRA